MVLLAFFVSLSTHADRQGVDISVTVFFCNFLLVCTDTDFSAVDKASSVIFYTVVNRRSWAGNLTFWGTLLQNRTNQIVCLLATTRLAQPEEVGPRVLWSRVGSACVDIRPYPKTDVLFHDFADKWKLQSSVLSCCSRVITPVTKLFWRTYKQFWNVRLLSTNRLIIFQRVFLMADLLS